MLITITNHNLKVWLLIFILYFYKKNMAKKNNTGGVNKSSKKLDNSGSKKIELGKQSVPKKIKGSGSGNRPGNSKKD